MRLMLISDEEHLTLLVTYNYLITLPIKGN